MLQVFAKEVEELADKVKKRDQERRLKMVEVCALARAVATVACADCTRS